MKQRNKYKARKLSDENLYSWYNYNIDKDGRTIYFGPWNDAGQLSDDETRDEWTVNDWSAQNLIKGLHVLEQEGNDQIFINWFSYGGDWDAGMAIYDYIKTCKSFITIKCFGRVRSMGTIILQAADERLLSQNCLFLIHYGSAAYETDHAKDFEMFNEQLIKDRIVMEDIYLERIREKKPRYSRERLQEMIKWDKYMTAKEAIELGLADRTI
jgi:ATP-dependent Clp protease, protease subunit